MLCGEWTSANTDGGGQGRPPGGGPVFSHVLKQDSIPVLTTLFLCRYSRKKNQGKTKAAVHGEACSLGIPWTSWSVIEETAQNTAEHSVNSIVSEASQTEVSACNWQCRKQAFPKPQTLIS